MLSFFSDLSLKKKKKRLGAKKNLQTIFLCYVIYSWKNWKQTYLQVKELIAILFGLSAYKIDFLS